MLCCPCTLQVIYSHAHAKALHHAPLAIVLLLPLLGSFGGSGNGSLTWLGLCGNALLALASVLCALLLPALLGAGRAYLSGGSPMCVLCC